MLGTLERLDEVADRLAALDVDALPDDELHEITVALQRQRARLGAVAARFLARWDARKVWAADQSRSPAACLAREVNCSPATDRVELRRAHTLASSPATSAAVAAGDLSLDHVDLLGRARAQAPGRFANAEPSLVAHCTTLRWRHAVQVVGYWRQHADPDGADADAAREHEGANLHASETLDGVVVINGVLDRVGGVVFLEELRRLEHELRLADDQAGVVRTAAQRRAAALVEMATRSASTPADVRRPRPLFSVLLGDDSFTKLCELASGTIIPPGSLVPYFDVADMETALFDGPSTVISVSHRRTFAGALRRAIQLRDRHCQHPSGCDVPADECDVDHIVPTSRGGITDQFHGRIECTTHNRHADMHDSGAVPLPHRDITILDEIRARLRWRYRHTEPDDDCNHCDTG